MTVLEKIEYMHKVQKGEISIFDDNGFDNADFEKYHSILDEFRFHPDTLDCDALLQIMRMFDDNCFELSWQLILAKIVVLNCEYYGKERFGFYLDNLNEVPKNGRYHGWETTIKMMSNELNDIFKEALKDKSEEVKNLVHNILK